MKSLKIDFTDKEITSWGGISLFREKLEMADILEGAQLPGQGSNGYSPKQLITNFWVGVWCVANCFEHLEVTCQDSVIKDIFDWERMAGNRAFQGYLNKFTQSTNQQVFTYLYQWFFNNLHFDNYTLDFDSTVITRYGNQQGARKGYNVHKRDRKSHHNIMAFVADCSMIANFWFRSGDSHPINIFLGFLEDTLEKLKGKNIGLIRADSGFYVKEIFYYLENGRENPVDYVIAAKLYRPIKITLGEHKIKMYEGIEIAETTCQAPDRDKSGRMVMVRQEIEKRPEAAGKQLHLFDDEGIYKNHYYSCFITNLKMSARMVYDMYRNRADAENRVKELKYDSGAENFNTRDFWATETTLNFVIPACNLVSLFRQAILALEAHPFMKTLRYRVFAIGSYKVKDGNPRILRLSLAMKKREWFTGLWGSIKTMSWPFVVPT